jgi:beta-phosphoglucomutase-like phosphatase (HAD superfamily)
VTALGLPLRPRIVDASHVTHAKPAPDLLLAGAQQLGVRPLRCWYVGDSTWDMQAARAAGMTAVGVTTGAAVAAALTRAGAELVARQVGDLQIELERALAGSSTRH